MEDKTKFAVYFNDEYIGEAESFCVEKGHKEVMPLLKITGDYQAGSD